MIEIAYKQMGDYQIPQVTLPKVKNLTQGKYSRMRLEFLKEHRKGLYAELMIDGKMEEYLGEVEVTTQKRVKQIIQELSQKFQVNEEMKANNQLEWVGLMNSIKNQAEEIAIQELIYN